MPGDAIEVKGWAELAAGTRDLAKRAEPATDRAFESVAQGSASRVAGAVPVVSGTLAGSVETTRDPVGVAIGSGVPYAGWIEFGGTRGRPYIAGGRYLYPIARGAEPELVVAAGHALDDATKAVQWSTPT